VTQDIVLKQTTLEEQVTVTAAPPVVDVTKSGVSTTYAKDELEKLPFSRSSYFDIINQTAGFATSSGESSSGSWPTARIRKKTACTLTGST
jgi:hypothetical protein